MVNSSEVNPEDILAASLVRLILVLYTGGTIGMLPSAKKALVPVKGKMIQHLKSMPFMHDQNKAFQLGLSDVLVLPGEIGCIAYNVIEYPTLLDSSNMNHSDWKKIAADIKENYAKYDGFIVVQGTDTLAYTASALSFMMENLQKPIVITGAQVPIFEPGTDGYHNIIRALHVAANPPITSEVLVVFGRYVLRGNRTMKANNQSFDAFVSPNFAPIAHFDINFPKRPMRLTNISASELDVYNNLAEDVTILHIYPNMQANVVRTLLTGVRGAVLLSFGNGNVPSNDENFLNALREAVVKRKVLIVNITQCLHGKVSYDYEAGAILKEIGVIPGYDMTPIAAFTKLACVLNRDIDHSEKIKLLESNMRGELTSNGSN